MRCCENRSAQLWRFLFPLAGSAECTSALFFKCVIECHKQPAFALPVSHLQQPKAQQRHVVWHGSLVYDLGFRLGHHLKQQQAGRANPHCQQCTSLHKGVGQHLKGVLGHCQPADEGGIWGGECV